MSEFTDTNADQVHAFALQMGNLGLSRVSELLVAMFQSGVWRSFKDGTGHYTFLPGEFDYFLTQQGVTRDLIMHGVRDVAIKASLEEAMDERRTGEVGYRRGLAAVRAELPTRLGNPIEPFGYTKTESRELDLEGGAKSRPALGRAPRTYRLTGGQSSKRPNERLPTVARLSNAAKRLSNDDLLALLETLNNEIASRQVESRPTGS